VDGLESRQQGDITATKRSKTESQGELKDLIYWYVTWSNEMSGTSAKLISRQHCLVIFDFICH